MRNVNVKSIFPKFFPSIMNGLILSVLVISMGCGGSKKKDESSDSQSGTTNNNVGGDNNSTTPSNTTTTVISVATTTTTTVAVTTTTVSGGGGGGGGGGTTSTTVPTTTTTTTIDSGTTTTTTVSNTTTTTTTVPATTTTTVPASTTTTTTVPSSYSLEFSSSPSTNESYAILNTVTVQLKNNGVLVSSATDTVTLSINSGTLYGTTSKAAVNGVATFTDLQVRATGSYTLTASATGYSSGTSNSFTINNGVAEGISGLAMWVKGNTFAANNGDSLCTIPDASGNGNSFFQANSSKCPTYIASAVNSKPAIGFDGTKITSTVATFNASAFAGITTFIVFSNASSSSDRVLFEHGPNFNNYAPAFVQFLNPSYVCSNCITSLFNSGSYLYNGKNSNTNTIPLNQFVYASAVYTKGATDNPLRLNGVNANNTMYSNGISNTFGNSTLYLGGRSDETINHNGKIAELLIFNRSLNTTEVQTIEAAIAAKYGL